MKEADSVIDSLVKSRPDVVVVGMGTCSPGDFSIGCRRRLVSPVKIFTCGGFVTQTASKPDYYHPLIKKLDYVGFNGLGSFLTFASDCLTFIRRFS